MSLSSLNKSCIGPKDVGDGGGAGIVDVFEAEDSISERQNRAIMMTSLSSTPPSLAMKKAKRGRCQERRHLHFEVRVISSKQERRVLS